MFRPAPIPRRRFLRRQNPLEVERVRRRDRLDPLRPIALAFPLLPVAALAAETAQELDGRRQRELFARESADEPPPADFAAQLHAAVDADEGGPGDGEPFSGDGPPEDDAGAFEELARYQFRQL